MSDKFTILFYGNRHLILKHTPEGNQVVVAECYLELNARLICQLLTADAKQKSDKETDEKL